MAMIGCLDNVAIGSEMVQTLDQLVDTGGQLLETDQQVAQHLRLGDAGDTVLVRHHTADHLEHVVQCQQKQ